MVLCSCSLRYQMNNCCLCMICLLSDGSLANNGVKTEAFSTPRRGTGPPIKNVKIRINPGDFNIKFIDGVTSTDTVSMLKQMIQEEASRLSVHSVKEGEDKASSGVVNISSNARKIPLCPVQNQRIMYMGRELKNNEARYITMAVLIYSIVNE